MPDSSLHGCTQDLTCVLLQVTGTVPRSQEEQVLHALSHIQDPDLGKDIVACGFVKELTISSDGAVSFTLQLTTPACPIKEEFRSQVCSCLSPFSAQPSKSQVQWQFLGHEHKHRKVDRISTGLHACFAATQCQLPASGSLRGSHHARSQNPRGQ